MYQKYYLLLLLVVQATADDNCTTPNNEPGKCIKLSSCAVLYQTLQIKHEPYVEEFVEKSLCGGTKFIPMVCCGSSTNFKLPKTNFHPRSGWELLPNKRQCGFQHSDDYYRIGNDTSVRINEFPWLARIKHTNSSGFNIMVDCAGSLINTRYILTAAICVDTDLYEPVGVRLGEFHKGNNTDCIVEPPYEEECSNFEDFGIEKIIIHPNYSNVDDSNDIALVRLNTSVTYSDYIRPICLPFPDTVRPKLGDVVFTSGWGYGDNKKNHKKRMLSHLIPKEECIMKLVLNTFHAVKLNEEKICSLLQNTEPKQACNSDAGGPVMFSIDFQWYQEGIVYFSITCRSERPEVHTSLTNYLKWIKNSLEP